MRRLSLSALDRLPAEVARPAYDINAVRLEWNGRMLGYVPKRDNADLARQMDHGAAVEARITELKRAANGSPPRSSRPG